MDKCLYQFLYNQYNKGKIMNNKLIKRLLMTTALGAASFAGINEAAAGVVVVNNDVTFQGAVNGSDLDVTGNNLGNLTTNANKIFGKVNLQLNTNFTLDANANRTLTLGDISSNKGGKVASFTFANNAGQVISVGSIGNGAKLDANSITFDAAGGTFEIKGSVKFDTANIIAGGNAANAANAVLALTGEKADIIVSKNQTVATTNLTAGAKLTIGSDSKGADVIYTSDINATDSTVITNGTKNVTITGKFNNGTLSVGTTGDKITTTVTGTIANAASTNINFTADSTLVAGGAVGNGANTAKIDFGGHSAKIEFQAEALISEISNDENAEIYAHNANITISATGEMNANIFAGKSADSTIAFSPASNLTVNGDINIDAAKAVTIGADLANSDVIFAGNITGATNQVTLGASNGAKITITNSTGSKEKPLTAIGTKDKDSNINLAADSFSKAYAGGGDATGSVSFGGDNDTTHKGGFEDSRGSFKTVGKGTVILDGAFTNVGGNGVRLNVGANTDLTKTFDLNADGSAIKFDQAVTLHAKAGVGQTNAVDVDFDNRKGTLELSGAASKIRTITNGSGSTVKMSSDHSLNFTAANNTANGAGLNVDASAVSGANRFVQVVASGNAGESVFGTVSTGTASFKFDGNAGFVTVGNLISPKVEFGNVAQTLIVDKDFNENKFGADIDVTPFKGNLTLSADGTVNSKKLALTTLTVEAGKTVNFDLGAINGDYRIDNFRVRGIASLASNLTNDGALNVEANGKLSLNKQVFTSNQAATFAANSTLQVSDEGSLFVREGDLTFTDGANVSVDKSALKRDRTVIFGKTSSGKINVKVEKINVSPSGNDWVIDSLYTLDANGKKIELDKPAEAGQKKGPVVAKADAKEAGVERALDDKKIKESLKDMSFTGADKQIADQLIANTDLDKSTGDAREFFVTAGAGNTDAKKDSIKSLKATTVQSVLTGITSAHQAAISTTASVVNSRMAVAASDDLQAKAGFWVRGTYGVGNRSESAEFSTNSYDVSTGSGTIGAEIVIAEDAVLGVAGTYAQTTVDYKGSKDGDKDKFKSMIGSVYATGTLSNNVVLNGSLMFANSDIDSTFKTLDAKVTDSASKDASTSTAKTEAPKVSATSYSGTALVGYKVDMSGFSVTPLVGARFGVFNEPARKTASNLATASELSNTKVDIAFGLSASGEVKASDMILVPELHGFGYYNVKGDKTSRSIVLDGLAGGSALTIDEKAAKFQFNVGASLTAKVGMVDYGAGIDGIFEDKSWFAQGSIKLRVSL